MPELAAKGIRLDRIIDLEIRYIYWNMLDPRVGGLAKEKIALRRALAMSYDVDAEKCSVIRNGQAVEANYPIPPGVVGHVPELEEHDQVRSGRRQRTARQVRLQARRRRLAHVARRQADGDPCTSRPDTLNRQLDEMVKKSYDAIGVAHGSARRTNSRSS